MTGKLQQFHQLHSGDAHATSAVADDAHVPLGNVLLEI